MKHLLLASVLALNSLVAFAQNSRLDPYPMGSLDLLSERLGFDVNVYDAQHAEPKIQFGPTAYQHPNTRSVFVPFKMGASELAKIAAASTVAVVFFANDEEIMNFQQEHKTSITEKLAIAGEAFGSEWGIGAVGAGLIIGVVMKNQEIKSVSLMAAKAMIVSGLATRALKTSVTRTRPNDTNDPYVFDGGADNHSFPSGHTTQAFALATVIAEAGKGHSKFIPILAYGAAALAGWSRVHDRAHWASDVIVGGLIGHLVAKSMMNAELAKKGLMIVPHVGLDGSFAVNLTYTGRAPELNCGEDMEGVDAFRDCMDKAFTRNRPIELF
ncbi:phosphatase PAP2 family protein [Peredibacter sp. HCB2-198]|uniref:phosphatase PAP2 family protein n=1 Tax=Peredibacter sp. HCB2-198 TaxID=3383025 RepID=UPI0038B4CD18